MFCTQRPGPLNARNALLLIISIFIAVSGSDVFAQCLAPSSWFPNTPEPPWTIEDTDAPDGCGFHQWSWQTFLWLNQPATNNPRTTKLAQLRYASELAGSGPRLNARVTKVHEATSIDQAMSSALVDQMGQVVYYTAQLNDVQFDAIKKYANTSDDLERNSKNPNLGYPAGALEVKAAWRVASTVVNGQVKTFIPNASQRFITFRDKVAPIKWKKQTNGYEPVADPDVPGVPTELAMVGFHIIGRTTNHPEFLWATFEHVDNAPLAQNTPTNSAGPTGPWSFYAAGVPANKCNVMPDSYPTPSFHPINVSNVKPYGGSDAQNAAAIRSLNQSVAGQLQADDVRKNYTLTGTLWTKPQKPSVDQIPGRPTAKLAGSVLLENTTLETRYQGTMSCFTCHSINDDDMNNLRLSHLVPAEINK